MNINELVGRYRLITLFQWSDFFKNSNILFAVSNSTKKHQKPFVAITIGSNLILI